MVTSIAMARVEQHRRKRLFRAQQIQRFLLASHMTSSAKVQAQSLDVEDIHVGKTNPLWTSKKNYNVVSDLFGVTKMAQMAPIQMHPRLSSFNAVTNAHSVTQLK